MIRAGAASYAFVVIAFAADPASAAVDTEPAGIGTGGALAETCGEVACACVRRRAGHQATFEVLEAEDQEHLLKPVRAVPGPAFEVKSPAAFAYSWDRRPPMAGRVARQREGYPFTCGAVTIPAPAADSGRTGSSWHIAATVAVGHGLAIALVLMFGAAAGPEARGAAA